MSFGQKVLEKYGWKKGEGLGKLNDGIKEAIKPKLKANNLGLGFKLGAEFQDNWWENIYNEAASNIKIESHEEESKPVVSTLANNTEYLPHKKKKDLKSVKEKYSLFQKKNEEEASNNVAEKTSISKEIDLFKKCGGRTVHKGARHGLSLSGKLERLEKHEKEMLHNLKGNEFKKKKKIKS